MTADTSVQNSTQGQRILRLYHFYRLTIGLALILLISSNLDEQLLDVVHIELFRTCLLYTSPSPRD